MKQSTLLFFFFFCSTPASYGNQPVDNHFERNRFDKTINVNYFNITYAHTYMNVIPDRIPYDLSIVNNIIYRFQNTTNKTITEEVSRQRYLFEL